MADSGPQLCELFRLILLVLCSLAALITSAGCVVASFWSFCEERELVLSLLYAPNVSMIPRRHVQPLLGKASGTHMGMASIRTHHSMNLLYFF